MIHRTVHRQADMHSEMERDSKIRLFIRFHYSEFQIWKHSTRVLESGQQSGIETHVGAPKYDIEMVADVRERICSAKKVIEFLQKSG